MPVLTEDIHLAKFDVDIAFSLSYFPEIGGIKTSECFIAKLTSGSGYTVDVNINGKERKIYGVATSMRFRKWKLKVGEVSGKLTEKQHDRVHKSIYDALLARLGSVWSPNDDTAKKAIADRARSDERKLEEEIAKCEQSLINLKFMLHDTRMTISRMEA